MSMFSLHITTPTTHLAWSCPNQGDAAEHAFPKKQMSLGPGFIRCCFFKWDSMGFQNTKRVSIIQHHPPTEKTRRSEECSKLLDLLAELAADHVIFAGDLNAMPVRS